jgi:dihydroxyacetone kinase
MGLLDGVAFGDVFQSPSANQMYQVTKEIDQGKGILYLYGDYTGDCLNFDMASGMAEIDGIKTRTVVGNDDVASSKKNKDALTRLDSKLGDGDLGLTMDKGFRAVCESFAKFEEENDMGSLFRKIGFVMSEAVPSTMGPFYPLDWSKQAAQLKIKNFSLWNTHQICLITLYKQWFSGEKPKTGAERRFWTRFILRLMNWKRR